MNTPDSAGIIHPVAMRRLRSAAYALWMAGWAIAHAPLAAQSIERPDPGTGDPGLSDLDRYQWQQPSAHRIRIHRIPPEMAYASAKHANESMSIEDRQCGCPILITP